MNNMLFDEKDFGIFNNSDSRNYFKEILQSYYSQNYRATIVLLYSFVIYDLFIKLQNMANEGDKKAKNKLEEINTKIENDEKYSSVENEIIQFFKDNCPLYFDRFIEDIDYLKNCRNKCSHLKVNDNTLYVPSDYHARMLICSMYDHVLSVKAPFIMDLFSFAKPDVEKYSKSMYRIANDGIDTSIKKDIIEKYLKRMTYDSLKKSYETYARLLFVSDDENCIKNIFGLYAFTFTMTEYAITQGYISLFSEDRIISIYSRIKVESLKEHLPRGEALTSIMTSSPIIMDIVRNNEDVFYYISEKVLTNPHELKQYKVFFPRESKSIYGFFKEKNSLHNPYHTEILYKTVNVCDDFDLAEYVITMASSIPNYDGYTSADRYMAFFKDHLKELSLPVINEVLNICKSNRQCTGRSRHEADMDEINKYISSIVGDDNEDKIQNTK